MVNLEHQRGVGHPVVELAMMRPFVFHDTYERRALPVDLGRGYI